MNYPMMSQEQVLSIMYRQAQTNLETITLWQSTMGQQQLGSIQRWGPDNPGQRLQMQGSRMEAIGSGQVQRLRFDDPGPPQLRTQPQQESWPHQEISGMTSTIAVKKEHQHEWMEEIYPGQVQQLRPGESGPSRFRTQPQQGSWPHHEISGVTSSEQETLGTAPSTIAVKTEHQQEWLWHDRKHTLGSRKGGVGRAQKREREPSESLDTIQLQLSSASGEDRSSVSKASKATKMDLTQMQKKLEKAQNVAKQLRQGVEQELKRMEEEEKAQREAEEKNQRETEEKAQREVEAKRKAEAEEKAQREVEAKNQREAEENARLKEEEEKKAQREGEEKNHCEAEAKKKAETEKTQREAEAKEKARGAETRTVEQAE